MKKSLYIKIILVIYATLLFSIKSNGQGFKNLDKDPHDIAYYRESKVSAPLVKVVYGRPTLKNNMEAFGNKIPFGELWRTGANEATEVKLYQDTVFNDIVVKAGTYVLLTIPGENEWEVILNSNLDVWGAYQYDPKANVARIKVPVSKANKLKSFSIAFKKGDEHLNMVLGWGSTRVKVPMRIDKDNYVAKL
ncbi:MAG: DUF2911 domain-containing protein [Flavobacteriaceae bacterium]|nr:DUF2911 domain-containing protein [Flavobacteriaceae bacterium]